jgi:ribosomal protein L10
MSNVEAKQAVVTEVAAVAKTAQSAVAAEYRGLTVAEMTKLRVAARQAGFTCASSKTRSLAGQSKARASSA